MDDLLEDLEAFLTREAPDVDGEDLPPMDDDYANRLLRRLRRQAKTRADVVAVATAERDRIDAWQRDRLASIDGDVDRVEQILEGYMRAVGERRKLRTLKLPNGELKLRPPRASVTIEDREAFMVWVLQRAETASGLDRDGFNAALAALTGERFLRLQLEPARGEIGKGTEIGPQRSTHEDLELLAAIVPGDGDVMPGVLYERAVADTFGHSLAVGALDTPIRHDVEDTPPKGGTDDDDRS